MIDKTDQIIEAAIKVFIRKGFLQATTLEIAKEAKVAEVTLYRKFSTKQKLFEFIVSKVLEDRFQMKMLKLANEEKDTDEFFRSILSDRLDIISRNEPMMKMLIVESLAGNLPDEINFINLIFTSLRDGLQEHFKNLRRKDDAEFYARQLGSILLGHAILPANKAFHQMDSNEKEALVGKYIRSLRVNM